jgi:hypothetical protein
MVIHIKLGMSLSLKILGASVGDITAEVGIACYSGK